MEFDRQISVGGLQRADFSGWNSTSRFQWVDSKGQISVGEIHQANSVGAWAEWVDFTRWILPADFSG